VSTEFDRDVVIRPAVPTDAEALSRLYNHYVEKTHVTFEEDPVTPGEMARRIQGVADADFPWIVGERSGRLVGYAYVCPWRPRKAYRFSAEATVYSDPALAGQGIGSQLYGALLPAVAARGIHVVVGVIALPNDASIRLHERFGFKKVAHLEEIGFKFGRWIDVGYWELKV
jgi:phosphinothricin acetyltransferase